MELERTLALKASKRETMHATISIGSISTTLGHPTKPELTCTVMSFKQLNLNVVQTTDHTKAKVTLGDLTIMNTAGAALQVPVNIQSRRERRHSSASLRMSRNVNESLVLGRGEYKHPGLHFDTNKKEEKEEKEEKQETNETETENTKKKNEYEYSSDELLAASSDEEEITLDLTNTVTVSNTTLEDPLISIVYETIENNNDNNTNNNENNNTNNNNNKNNKETNDGDTDNETKASHTNVKKPFPIVASINVQIKRLHLMWSGEYISNLTQFVALESNESNGARDQMDALVFSAANQANQLRQVGEARAKDAMNSASRILIFGRIEAPDVVIASPVKITDESLQRPLWSRRDWLIIRLGTLILER